MDALSYVKEGLQNSPSFFEIVCSAVLIAQNVVCVNRHYILEKYNIKKERARNDKVHCESVFCYFDLVTRGFARAADLIFRGLGNMARAVEGTPLSRRIKEIELSISYSKL